MQHYRVRLKLYKRVVPPCVPLLPRHVSHRGGNRLPQDCNLTGLPSTVLFTDAAWEGATCLVPWRQKSAVNIFFFKEKLPRPFHESFSCTHVLPLVQPLCSPLQVIGLLPESALVGLVTYGTQVQVHELGFSQCPKMYVFRGGKEISKNQILDQLGLAPTGVAVQRGATGPGVGPGGVVTGGVSRFLLPVSECEFTLAAVGPFPFSFLPLCPPLSPPPLNPRAPAIAFPSTLSIRVWGSDPGGAPVRLLARSA